ncbi:MAG: sigma-70 family RNA polymerase sigma factor [Ruminococcaceae bacterium]|nr:sigma-70 family RNA polymerase sigma factor [Oscillospiraceae bacterium]
MLSNSELIKEAQSGNKAALEELVRNNLGLVRSIVQRFKDRNAEYEDLMQIGTLGMIKAVKSFDFSYNTVFSTYAVPLIIGEIKKFLRDDGIIKVSRELRRCGVSVMKQKEMFISRHGREPKISELCSLCSLSEEALISALEAVSPIHSLSESIVGDDGLTLEDTIADKNSPIELTTDKLALTEAIKKLEPLHRKIIILRYFKDFSQQKTGNILGLTQVKVSREEKKILKLLKEAL